MPDSLECTLGVMINGESVDVYEIPNGYDTQNFSGVFDVKLANSFNGNGSYDVVVKQPVAGLYKMGMSLGGGWKISKARIYYNWLSMSATLFMTDDKGDVLELLKVWEKSRPYYDTVVYFNSSEIIKRIVDKAKEIAKQYVSVEIYNEIEEYNETKKWLDYAPHEQLIDVDDVPTPQEYIKAVEDYVRHLREFVEIHNKVVSLLEPSADKRSKDLIEKLKSQLNSLMLKKSLPLYK